MDTAHRKLDQNKNLQTDKQEDRLIYRSITRIPCIINIKQEILAYHIIQNIMDQTKSKIREKTPYYIVLSQDGSTICWMGIQPDTKSTVSLRNYIQAGELSSIEQSISDCPFMIKVRVSLNCYDLLICTAYLAFILIPITNNQMQGSSNGSHILRNSYGYQMHEPPILRSPPSKGFPMPNTHYNHPPQETISSTIRTMENKIEGMQNLVKKKNFMQASYTPSSAGFATPESRFRNQYPASQQPEEQYTEGQLRGSCQNIIKKFDYSNLRNTTHYNPLTKFSGQGEIRRSPNDEGRGLRMNNEVNRTVAQESASTFLKPIEKKQLESKHSFINSPAKTPPKFTSQRIVEQPVPNFSRTPPKYKAAYENPNKVSATSKTSTDVDEKKTFKSLNEIIESKHKEKLNLQDGKSSRKRSKILNGFQFGVILGKGKFGQVFLTRHAQTGFVAAIKKIQKAKVVEFKMTDQFVKQIRLHSSLDHPNIVKFYGVFQENKDIYLVMQYMNGGTLFDYLNEVTCLNIKEAAEYLKDIIEALTHMHDKSIAHRDIKPENIVISSEGVAKLCDFGWSAIVQTSRKTYCGTFDYAPPEILERKNYDTSVDIWCIGVLTYELLTGRVPFQGQKRNVVMDKIVNVDKFKIDYPSDMPPEARQFIQSLVQKDPALRPKCHDLLKHRLFTMHLPKPGKSKKMQ